MSRRAWSAFLQKQERQVPGAGARAHKRVLRRPKPAEIDVQIQCALAVDAAIPRRQVLPVIPVAKPRQTQRDRWMKRPCVMRYRAFCDELRMRGAQLAHRYSLVFVLPMPRSWSAGKRRRMNGQPHFPKPDLSNLQKSVEDALVPNDECLWSNRGLKLWGEEGRVIILRTDGIPESDATLCALALGDDLPMEASK